jgi:hypothetical protein
MNIKKNIKENKVEIIENILPKINLDLINMQIVNSNIDTLTKIFVGIKNIYTSLPTNINDFTYENNIQDSKLKKTIQIQILRYFQMVNSEKLNLFKSFDKIFRIGYGNLEFFYLYKSNSELQKDLKKILEMFKIFITMGKYFVPNNTETRYVIWIPIDSDRDFTHNHIDSENLKECVKEYKAFTVSGVTHSTYPNPRITVITRYEEIEKLLIHELIHNLHLDGSNYHDKLDLVISNYNKIKKTNNYSYEFSIYESYTEMLSTYLYLLFKNINSNIQNLKNILLGQILIEIIYSYNTIVNLAKLNKYKNYKDFIEKEELRGSICFFEYYYVKGLLYNNLILVFPKNFLEFAKLYENITRVVKNSFKDKFLEHMFKNYQKQKNYKYIFN